MYSDYHHPTEDILTQAVATNNNVSRDKVIIKSHSDVDGTNDGENFTSVMKLITIEATVDDKPVTNTFMAKMHSKGSPLTQCWDEMDIFPREAQFYAKVVPKLNAILEGQPPLPFPKTAFADEDVPILIMENLKASGFSMCDASKGWGIDKLELTFKEYARMHAASYHLIQTVGLHALRKDLSYICDFGYKGLWALRTEALNQASQKMTMASVNGAAALGAKNLDNDDLARRFKEYDIEAGAQQGGGPSEKFDVIIRGDAWSNNFMFRYDDEGKATDVRFVDLQVTKRCRPTMDLSVLLCTSTTGEVREKHEDALIKMYHETLLEQLAKLGYPSSVYTMEQLLKDYKITMGYAMFYGFLNINTVLNPKVKDVAKAKDLDSIASGMTEDKGEDASPELVKRLCEHIREGEKWKLY